VALLAEKKSGGGKGRFQRAAPTVLKDLGEHPGEGGKVQVLAGRYGPYVKHGEVNATLPRGKEPAALTIEEAVQLIAERIAKGPAKPKAKRGARSQPRPANAAAKPSKAKAKAPQKSKSAQKSKAKPAGTREAAE
jgi:DNA topoisomerase-1